MTDTNENISANYDKLNDKKEVKFYFRTVKLTDDAGKETGETYKRPDVKLELPVPSVEGVISIIETGGKGLELLLEAASNVVIDRAREIVNEKEDISQDNFPFELISWEAIAKLPKAERRGGGISKEVWEDFGKDYMEVMPAATGKPIKTIELGCKLLLTKFATVKTNKAVLRRMQEYLAVYINSSPNAAQFIECVEFLNEKAKLLLKVSDEDILAAL